MSIIVYRDKDPLPEEVTKDEFLHAPIGSAFKMMDYAGKSMLAITGHNEVLFFHENGRVTYSDRHLRWTPESPIYPVEKVNISIEK